MMFRPNDFRTWARRMAGDRTRAKYNAFESGAWSVFCQSDGYYPSQPYLQADFDDGAHAARLHLRSDGVALCCDHCERELPAFLADEPAEREGGK